MWAPANGHDARRSRRCCATKVVTDTLTNLSTRKDRQMRYHQITPEERYTLVTLLRQVPKPSCAAIARLMQRHRSTISRELRRNGSRHDDSYRFTRAQEQANGRRSRSRRKSHFGTVEWNLVDTLLREKFSPEQITGWLR